MGTTCWYRAARVRAGIPMVPVGTQWGASITGPPVGTAVSVPVTGGPVVGAPLCRVGTAVSSPVPGRRRGLVQTQLPGVANTVVPVLAGTAVRRPASMQYSPRGSAGVYRAHAGRTWGVCGFTLKPAQNPTICL